MTNCDYIKHVGKKTEKDLSICIGTFRKITVAEWTLMCMLKAPNTFSSSGNLDKNITITETPQISQEEIRNKRLAFFNNINF